MKKFSLVIRSTVTLKIEDSPLQNVCCTIFPTYRQFFTVIGTIVLFTMCISFNINFFTDIFCIAVFPFNFCTQDPTHVPVTIILKEAGLKDDHRSW